MKRRSQRVTFEFEPSPRQGFMKVTAKVGQEVLATGTFDVSRSRACRNFVGRVAKARPDLDRETVETEFRRSLESMPTTPEPSLQELDRSRIVRPELFHTPEVSGVLIPCLTSDNSRHVAQWHWYLRWADGRRERRPPGEVIEVPGQKPLWFDPVPNAPSSMMRPEWSVESRERWLKGEAAPDPYDVFARICNRVEHFLDFLPEFEDCATNTLALWVLLTYVAPAWSCVPYLYVTGPKGSGKTQVLRVLGKMVFRPLESSNLTSPCLFRTLHEQGGTLLLDEAERLREGTPDMGELRSILLSGYKRGSPARRLEKVGDTYQPACFEVFGPKALVSIAGMPDALGSRCIRMTMLRAAADSPKSRHRLEEHPEVWQGIRDDLHVLALEYGSTWIELANRTDVVPSTFAGREFELWQPLLALASWIDEISGRMGRVGRKHTPLLLPATQTFAGQVNETSREDSIADTDEMLLELLAEKVKSGTQNMLAPSELLALAKGRDEPAFKHWSLRAVSTALGRYGVATTKHHGKRTYAGVTLATLQQIQQRYSLDLGVGMDASQPSQTSPSPTCATSAIARRRARRNAQS